MPSMANITVKAANGTTDVVLQQKNPSSGDGTVALWRADALASVNYAKPTVSVSARPIKAGTTRRITERVSYPYAVTDSTTGQIKVIDTIYKKVEWDIPQGIPDSVVAEAVALGSNVEVSALMVSVVKEGYAPA